jgi:catechol 2,3-dioxygenase-like lactoylglutathione lyase family enzyme
LTVTAKDRDAVFLAGSLDHHSVVLHQGPAARCARLGFQIGPDEDLDAFERQIAALGVKTVRRRDPAPSVSDALALEDPKGTVLEVFKRPELSGHKLTGKGVAPNKLGHVAFHVTDAQRMTRFYCDVLGFRVSDWMGEIFSFLRCGPDHHTVNFMQTGSNRHFHTAFELRDWAHLQTACDFLSLSGYRTIWGPGRHGIGHNLFAYHRAPDGLITELFAELDQMQDEALGYFEPRPWHRDSPQRPKVWEPGPWAGNLWGGTPRPDEMMQ